MKVTTLSEQTVADIGHAFSYYDYAGEHGLIDGIHSMWADLFPKDNKDSGENGGRKTIKSSAGRECDVPLPADDFLRCFIEIFEHKIKAF